MRIKVTVAPQKGLDIRRMLCDDPKRLRLDEERLRANYLEGFDLLFDHEREMAFWPLSAPFWEGPR